MKLLERTIFKKKNDEIEKLQEMIVDVSQKSEYNYEQNRELENKVNLLEEDKETLEKKIRQINDIKEAYIKQINRLNKIHEETINSYESSLKALNNELLETRQKLEESMTDKFLRRKVRPATRSQKQTI